MEYKIVDGILFKRASKMDQLRKAAIDAPGTSWLELIPKEGQSAERLRVNMITRFTNTKIPIKIRTHVENGKLYIQQVRDSSSTTL